MDYTAISAPHFAAGFAGTFSEELAGEWMGWFHDAGKASSLFQGVLDHTEYHVNHAAAGAALLWNVHPQISRAIYAHHDGLVWWIKPDLDRSAKETGAQDSQNGDRFAVSGKQQYSSLNAFMRSIPGIPLQKRPVLQDDIESGYAHLPEMLHTRMLLSCLCDADYTASASHEDPDVLRAAEENKVDGDRILRALTAYRNEVKANSHADTSLNTIRDTVYLSCLEAAEQEPGLFTLTAPTGTGKTIALLAFAARHAAKYHKRRIIVVLPFLSIITQNASVYREICGDLLEAHSMVSYGNQGSVRLLAERWNAPVIVTTSVKFFETFFKSQPSDLRYLHSIADSVIVFDEAQSIPQNLVGTTMETMRCLCETFHCTVLLSTATQPAFDVRPDVTFTPREIMKDPAALYAKTDRVRVEWRLDPPVPLEEIADEMAALPNVCCVMNRKDHTQKLYQALIRRCSQEECFHISTDMCKAHRDAVLKQITERLAHCQPCRLVSTSCIEAGVDLDFAVMYRALAPLEAIIQCAGRCNRNGKQEGRMIVFLPDEEKRYPTIAYQNAARKVELLLSRHPVSICDPSHIREYYTALFGDANYDHDKPALVKAIEKHDFAEVEKQYRFIPQSGVNVLVPYAEQIGLFEELTEEAEKKGITKDWMRRAAAITVTCYREEKLRDLAEQCVIYERGKPHPVPGWYILLSRDCYDAHIGLHFEDDSSLEYCL